MALAVRLPAAIIGLGGYKLVVAHAKGYHNVGFLWIMMIGGGLVFTGTSWTLPRLSHQGNAYLERLKLAYGDMTRAQLDDDDDTGRPTGWSRPAARAGLELRWLIPTACCSWGSSSISSLADTPLSDLNTMFARGSSGSGCGGGCGGSNT